MSTLKIIFIGIASILFMGSSIAPNAVRVNKTKKSMLKIAVSNNVQCPAVTGLQVTNHTTWIHISWGQSPDAYQYIIGGYFNNGGTISDSTSGTGIDIYGDASGGGLVAVRAECSSGVYSTWVYQSF